MKYSDIEGAFLFVSSAPPHEHYAYLNKENGVKPLEGKKSRLFFQTGSAVFLM